MMGSAKRPAQAALFVGTTSLCLMLGALTFQYVWGYAPCELCVLQRWPHGLAIALGLVGGLLSVTRILPAPASRLLAWGALLAIAASGVIGAYHAGVEWKFWPGPSACTGGGGGFTPGGGSDFTPFRFVRCDEAAWRFLGISMAGYNALFSIAAANIAALILRRKP